MDRGISVKSNKLSYITIGSLLVFMITASLYPFLTDLDISILKRISQMRTENLTDFMIFISYIGSFSIHIWIIGAICLLYMLIRKYSVVVLIIFNLLFSISLNGILKEIFHRPRPEMRMLDVAGYSFPSGHTMNNFAIYAFFIFLVLISTLNKKLKIILTVFMFLLTGTIAFSRMYLAVHYPTDIIGGICGGLFVATVSIHLYQKYCK